MHTYAVPTFLPGFEEAPPEFHMLNGFTIGKRYLVLIRFGDDGRLGVVRNDNGHERVIPMDESPTAHIMCAVPRPKWPLTVERIAGYFLIEESPTRLSP